VPEEGKEMPKSKRCWVADNSRFQNDSNKLFNPHEVAEVVGEYSSNRIIFAGFSVNW
jgi:hypothetical protein